MGYSYNASCNECGHDFMVSEGGGFFFELFRCEVCGKTKSISRNQEQFEQYWLRHLLHRKRLGEPSQGFERYLRPETPREPLTEEQFESIVELEVVGKCECGGQFRWHAPVRCPKCRSTNIRDMGGGILYD